MNQDPESTSPLQTFLQQQRAQGRTDSVGQFTINRAKARVKSAESALPFAQAWTLKVIQALVAAGVSQRIVVSIGRTETRITTQGASWPIDRVEEAFYNGSAPRDSGGLGELIVGLSAVAVHQKRAFSLTPGSALEALLWDGDGLRTGPARSPGFDLAVAHSETRSLFSYSPTLVADIHNSFSEYCFPCPVELEVDGRRLDALQFANFSGWLDAVPVGMGLLTKGDLPSFTLAPGTFEDLVERVEFDGGYYKLGGLSELKPQGEVCCAVLFAVQPGNLGFRQDWSKILWVRDGVVVDAEPLTQDVSEGVLGCFVSAEGLRTDLTTLTLVESSERKHRVRQVVKAVRSLLAEPDIFSSQGYRVLETRAGLPIGMIVSFGLSSSWLGSFFRGARNWLDVVSNALKYDPDSSPRDLKSVFRKKLSALGGNDGEIFFRRN